jgi:peptidoglycan hydrolase-like protein with peptidoglycan-binding domain
MTISNRRYIPDPLGRLGQGHWVDGKPRDPFGRLFEPEPEESFDLAQPFSLSKSIGEGGNNSRADVAKIETLLGLAGAMDLKSTDGPTGFAGQRLLDGIRIFQKQNGLSVDGRLNPGGPTLKALSQSLQSMGRNGDTVLAHLTPAEAQVLHAITDGGSINPKTGLLEFWTGNPGDRDNANANPGFAGPSGSNNADTVGEKMKEMHNAREAAMAAASPTPSPNNANTVGEKMKEIHNARQAKMAAASLTSSPNNTNTVGEKMKEMHNARQARIAAAPDIPAGKANPNLLENVLKSPPPEAKPQSSQLDRPRPSMTQQVKTARKAREDAEKKAQLDSEKARQAKARRGADYGKPKANPYTGDINAMIALMNEMKPSRKTSGPVDAPPSEVKSFFETLYDDVVDSLNKFKDDPNNAPVHMPPLDPPPSGPPAIPTKKKDQQTQMTAVMLAALAAMAFLGLFTNKNSGGPMK